MDLHDLAVATIVFQLGAEDDVADDKGKRNHVAVGLVGEELVRRFVADGGIGVDDGDSGLFRAAYREHELLLGADLNAVVLEGRADCVTYSHEADRDCENCEQQVKP